MAYKVKVYEVGFTFNEEECIWIATDGLVTHVEGSQDVAYVREIDVEPTDGGIDLYIYSR